MLKGLSDIEQKTKETQELAQGDYIRTLKLANDKEFAEFRFLTTPEEVISARFHNIEEMTPNGNRWRSKYCVYEDNGSCQFCASGNTAGKNIFLWAFVYNIYHSQQNPRLDKDQNAKKWIRVTKEGLYKEEVNKPMIFKMKPGRGSIMQNTLIQYAREHDGFSDRDYKFIRSGVARDKETSYQLIAKDPSEFKNFDSIKGELPDLADVVMGKVKSFGQKENIPEAVNETEDNGKLDNVPDSSGESENLENLF